MNFARLHYDRRRRLLKTLEAGTKKDVELAIEEAETYKKQYNNVKVKQFYIDIITTLKNPKNYLKKAQAAAKRLKAKQAADKKRNTTITIIVEGKQYEVQHYTTHRTDNYRKIKKMLGVKI